MSGNFNNIDFIVEAQMAVDQLSTPFTANLTFCPVYLAVDSQVNWKQFWENF